MLLLASSLDLLQVVTSSTTALDVHVSYVDNASGTVTPGRTNTSIISASTTTVLASPATGAQRNVKYVSLVNKGTISDVIIVKHTDGTTPVSVMDLTLLGGEQLNYDSDGVGWVYYSASGAIQYAVTPSQATGFSAAAPTGGVSTTEKAMGLAFAFTPNKTGNVIIFVGGVALNATAAGDGTNVTGRFGTGTAPVNGATSGLGTSFGLPQHFIASTTAGQQGFIVMGKVTGLTIGTAIWVDLSLLAVTGGGSTVKDVQCIVIEVP